MSKPSSSTATAGGGSGVGPSRRTWDKDDFARKAMSREKRAAELDSVNSERRSQGLPPLKRLKSNAPEPELAMQQRRAPLGLQRNEGKTLMVDLTSGDGKGQTGPGFYCEVCRKLLKDNLAYLDHVNGRGHLMRIGQSTQQDRATLDEVLETLEELRRKQAEGAAGKKSAVYDFDERIRRIAEQEEKEREEKRAKRRQQKTTKKSGSNPAGADTEQAAPEGGDAEDAMMAAMGFGGFGSTKKR
ncbi:Zinc finger, U1-type [Kalmanozyma brasiliensis GHG001]|uniref:U1-type domain-containing protein n=1 Tax=Kalmanozyma brasiliensis (strain GHG001) TaxID=1365824 RepID=V5GRD2_KALBG|nr:Zinc finger, U1-type [Kalmanozyma brasiliensis GHG001]EST08502.1 Zinc finger, U1-type [Kalmanozyma brasiliensis GHG001]